MALRPHCPRRPRSGPSAALLAALVALLGVLLGGGACGEGDEGAAAAADGVLPRSRDPRVAELQAAVDGGRLDVVEALLPRLPPGLEVALARVRFELLRGDTVAALRELESARERWPADPRVFATGAELYALLGRADAAQKELEAGLALDPESPALERARGVALLARPGGASAGLQHLELAVAEVPDLPYAARPLAQARRLVAREALAAGDPARAEAHVLGALDLDPRDLDARLLLADALAAQADFEGAIEIHRALMEEGRGRPQELAMLHKRAALAVLLEGDRPTALAHFDRARELGLGEEALGWGATALREEGERLLEVGIEHYRAERFADALIAFEEGLDWDPSSAELAHKRGMALFRLGRFEDAADAWRDARRLGEEQGGLPVPIHLDLARALRLAGEVDAAREELDRYLADTPEGPWAEAAREMRSRL